MKKQGSQGDISSQCKNRRNTVPVIYTRGTHYQIGFDIGKTFAETIREHVDLYWPLNDIYLPLYETLDGQKVYDETLACVEKQYPQYLREIQGTADGSGVPFHKLFLMHLDEILPNVLRNGARGNTESIGCTAVICNEPGQEILGHNEDVINETMNHWYLIDAHVIEFGYPEEKFCSLSYAGFLPGYTMGYNHHGLVYSVNTLYAKNLRSGKTPRYFLGRALLGAGNYAQVENTLRNEGHGAAEGFAINLTFQLKGDRTFYNIEVAPVEEDESCSKISILKTGPGEYFHHCNNYMRLSVAEGDDEIRSSIHRNSAVSKHKPPKDIQDIISILSDQSDDLLPVYRESGENSKTVATGIFDLVKRTWAIYTDKPVCNEPVVILPLHFAECLLE